MEIKQVPKSTLLLCPVKAERAFISTQLFPLQNQLFLYKQQIKTIQDLKTDHKVLPYVRLMTGWSTSNIANSVFSLHLATVSNLYFQTWKPKIKIT